MDSPSATVSNHGGSGTGGVTNGGGGPTLIAGFEIVHFDKKSLEREEKATTSYLDYSHHHHNTSKFNLKSTTHNIAKGGGGGGYGASSPRRRPNGNGNGNGNGNSNNKTDGSSDNDAPPRKCKLSLFLTPWSFPLPPPSLGHALTDFIHSGV